MLSIMKQQVKPLFEITVRHPLRQNGHLGENVLLFTGQQYMRRSFMHPRHSHRSGSVPSPLEMYFSEVDLDVRKQGRSERQTVIG